MISAAQSLLKKQIPLVGGFQPPYHLGHTCAFDIQSEEFIYTNLARWPQPLAVSTVGAEDEPEVYVYDSMYPSVGTYTKKQVTSFCARKRRQLS